MFRYFLCFFIFKIHTSIRHGFVKNRKFGTFLSLSTEENRKKQTWKVNYRFMSPWNNAILENFIKFSNCLFFIFSMEIDLRTEQTGASWFVLFSLHCNTLPCRDYLHLLFAVLSLVSASFLITLRFPLYLSLQFFRPQFGLCLLDFPLPCLDLPACFRTDILVLTCACFHKPVSLFVAAAASGTLWVKVAVQTVFSVTKLCSRHNNSTVMEYISN